MEWFPSKVPLYFLVNGNEIASCDLIVNDIVLWAAVAEHHSQMNNTNLLFVPNAEKRNEKIVLGCHVYNNSNDFFIWKMYATAAIIRVGCSFVALLWSFAASNLI